MVKAAVIQGFGGLDVLSLADGKEQAAAPDGVVLQVLCPGLNHLSIWVREGGRIILCAVTTGANAETDLPAFCWNQFNAMGSMLGSVEGFHQMLRAGRSAVHCE